MDRKISRFKYTRQSQRKQVNSRSILIFLLMGLFAFTAILLFADIHKKKQELQSALYIWKPEKLADITKRQFPQAKVVLNENLPGEDFQLKLLHNLTIGPRGDDENYIFSHIIDAETDSNGKIYILSFDDDFPIRIYDSTGIFLKGISGKGKGPGEIMMPVDFNIADNIIHVLEYGNMRISKFSLAGQFLGTTMIKLSRRIPKQFAIDDSGNYYISYLDVKKNQTIHVFNKKGKYLRSFGEPLYLQREIHFAERGSIWEDRNIGNLYYFKHSVYFSRSNPYEIKRYLPNGKLDLAIFRKNNFMPPDKMEVEPGPAYVFSVPVYSARIKVIMNRLINLIVIPPGRLKKYENGGFVIDIFNLQGKLLQSYIGTSNLKPLSVDNFSNVYFYDNEKGEILRYKLQLGELN